MVLATLLTVFVAAFGSNKVGVLDANGAVTRRIDVGPGPSGLVLDEPRNRLYVLNRFFNTVSSVNLSDDSSVQVPTGFDPAPLNVQERNSRSGAAGPRRGTGRSGRRVARGSRASPRPTTTAAIGTLK